MSNSDGGPAFPAPYTGNEHATGMSLRDYFAAKAMQAMIASAMSSDGFHFLKAVETIPSAAYSIADLMVSESNK